MNMLNDAQIGQLLVSQFAIRQVQHLEQDDDAGDV